MRSEQEVQGKGWGSWGLVHSHHQAVSLLPVVFHFSFVLIMKPCFPQSVERLFPES